MSVLITIACAAHFVSQEVETVTEATHIGNYVATLTQVGDPRLGAQTHFEGESVPAVTLPERWTAPLADGADEARRAGHWVRTSPLDRCVLLGSETTDEEIRIGEGLLINPAGVAFLDDGRLVVTDADRARVECFRVDGTHLFGFGDFGAFPGLLSTPLGVDCWNGRIFVADSENHRIQVFDEAGEALYSFGVHALRPGEGEGALHYPTDVHVSEDGGAAAVLEPLDGRVQVFARAPGAEPPEDPTRVGIGPSGGHFGRIASIDGQFMVLAEPETRRVLLYDLRIDDPVRIGSLCGKGERLGMALRTTGLHLDSERRSVLVADGALRRLSRAWLDIDPEETLRNDPARESWAEAIEFELLGPRLLDDSALRIVEPGPLDVDARGRILMIDRANDRVLVLSSDLEPEASVKPDGLRELRDLAAHPSGTSFVLAHGGGVSSVDSKGGVTPIEGAEELRDVTHVAFDPKGNLTVVERAAHRVSTFGLAGGILREVGRRGVPGLEAGHFREPAEVGFDNRGRMLVIDHGNHRGQIFDADGRLIHAFGPRLYIRPLKRALSGATGGR